MNLSRKGFKVFPISAVTGQGIKELLILCKYELLDSWMTKPVVFEQEYFPEDELI